MPFSKCFKDNMEALGLPAPTTLFGSVSAAVATISAISKAVSTYGTKVTIEEIVAAGILEGSVAAGLGEILGAVGGVLASFYLGCCVGSLLACTIDKIFFSDIRQSPVPRATATLFLSHKHIYLSEAMWDVMLDNDEMLGVRPDDDYEPNTYYAYA